MNGCKHYRPDNSPDCFEYPDAPKYCKGVNCYYKQLKKKEETLQAVTYYCYDVLLCEPKAKYIKVILDMIKEKWWVRF